MLDKAMYELHRDGILSPLILNHLINVSFFLVMVKDDLRQFTGYFEHASGLFKYTNSAKDSSRHEDVYLMGWKSEIFENCNKFQRLSGRWFVT